MDPLTGEDNRDGIQAEEPVPPWEQPGCFRRDCEPHRGEFLNLLGVWCVVLGTLAAFFIVPAVVALPLCLTTWLMARRDLALMRAGRMDPGGEWQVTEARRTSLVGLALSLLWVAWVLAGHLIAPYFAGP